MKSKISAAILSVITIIVLMTLASFNVLAENVVASGSCGDDLTWTLDDSGTLSISGTGAMYNYSSSSSNYAPWYDARTSIKNVVIEDGVTSVGNYAFYNCRNFTEIVIPDSVKTIGSFAFYFCYALEDATIGNGVKTVDSYAFYGCIALENVTIGKNVETISNDAFRSCRVLTEIVIPDNVKTIGTYAFGDCPALKSITIGSGIETISKRAFSDCSALAEIFIPDSVKTIGEYAFYSCDNLQNVTIGGGVETIGSYAFYNCNSLTEIIVPNSVNTIGEYAFYSCDNLENVVIYSKNATLDSNIFKKSYLVNLNGYAGSTTETYAKENDIPFYYIASTECGDNLTWTLEENGTLVISGTGDMYDFSNSSLNHAPWYDARTSIKNVVIEDGVTSVGNYAFYNCRNFTEIVIPDSVKTIGSFAFYFCYALEDATIGNGVKTVDSYAFYGCIALENVTIGKNVETISNDAFRSCRVLTEIVIPDNVKTIGTYAFGDCPALKSITIGSGIETISKRAFSDCSALAEIIVPNSVKTIGENAFAQCYSLSIVNYMGTQSDWNNITIGSYNSPLLNANIIYLLEKDSVPFEGAQIRTEGEQGLRYIFKMPKVLYKNCAEFGSVVMPKKYLGENALEIGLVTTVNGKNYAAKKVPAIKLFGEDNEYIYYTVCITHIRKSNYSSEYVAVPYFITKSGTGTDRITYGEEQEMTVNEVMQGLSE